MGAISEQNERFTNMSDQTDPKDTEGHRAGKPFATDEDDTEGHRAGKP